MEKPLNIITLPEVRLPKRGPLPALTLKEVKMQIKGLDIELGYVPSLPKVTFHLNVLEFAQAPTL